MYLKENPLSGKVILLSGRPYANMGMDYTCVVGGVYNDYFAIFS